jgi:hypothetical protein
VGLAFGELAGMPLAGLYAGKKVTAVEKRNRQRSDAKHIAAKAARFGIAPSKKSFITGDVEEAASAIEKQSLSDRSYWQDGSSRFSFQSSRSLLLFGFRQL